MSQIPSCFSRTIAKGSEMRTRLVVQLGSLQDSQHLWGVNGESLFNVSSAELCQTDDFRIVLHLVAKVKVARC